MLKALESMERFQLEDLNKLGKLTAPIGTVLAKAHGVELPNNEWCNPYGELLKIQEAKEFIDQETAAIAQELFQSGELPTWAARLIDMEEIERALR